MTRTTYTAAHWGIYEIETPDAGGPGAAPQRRGSDPFVQLPWSTALDLVAREIERVRGHFGNDAIFGGSYGWSSAGRFHHAVGQLHLSTRTDPAKARGVSLPPV